MVRRTTPFSMSLGPLLLGFLLGCGQGDRPPQGTSSTTAPAASGTAPPASATTTVAAKSTDHPWAGKWSGRFEAKKADVTVPEGVAYPVWEKDEGGDASGAGTIELTIAPDGEVTGTGTGALGAFAVRGRVEGEILRSGVTPADPSGDASMSGVLTAKAAPSGKKLEAVLRVAGGKGARVRTATFVLAQGALSGDANTDGATPAPSASGSADANVTPPP